MGSGSRHLQATVAFVTEATQTDCMIQVSLRHLKLHVYLYCVVLLIGVNDFTVGSDQAVLVPMAQVPGAPRNISNGGQQDAHRGRGMKSEVDPVMRYFKREGASTETCLEGRPGTGWQGGRGDAPPNHMPMVTDR